MIVDNDYLAKRFEKWGFKDLSELKDLSEVFKDLSESSLPVNFIINKIYRDQNSKIMYYCKIYKFLIY